MAKKKSKVLWFWPRARKATKAEVRRRLNRAAAVVERRAKELVSGPAASLGEFGKTSRSGPPGVRSGTLRRSITWQHIIKQHGELAVRVGTNVEYARHLEFGSGSPITIRPRRARMLAIPVGKGTKLKGRNKSPREFKDLHVRQGTEGPYLATARGKPMFLLRKSVTIQIPPRPFLRPALSQSKREVKRIMVGR